MSNCNKANNEDKETGKTGPRQTVFNMWCEQVHPIIYFLMLNYPFDMQNRVFISVFPNVQKCTIYKNLHFVLLHQFVECLFVCLLNPNSYFPKLISCFALMVIMKQIEQITSVTTCVAIARRKYQNWFASSMPQVQETGAHSGLCSGCIKYNVISHRF